MNPGRNEQGRLALRAIACTLGLGTEPVIESSDNTNGNSGGNRNGNAPAHLRGGFVIVTLLTCLVSAASAAERPVRWRSPDVAARASMTSVEAAQAMADITDEGDVRHVVVQFFEPVGAALRAQLGDAGVELLAALGDHAFFATIDRNVFRPEQVGQNADIRALEMTDHPVVQKRETVVARDPDVSGMRVGVKKVVLEDLLADGAAPVDRDHFGIAMPLLIPIDIIDPDPIDKTHRQHFGAA